ncbi:MAG: hypothetical protein ACRD1N_03240 [Terriglobia bacterium]
MTLENIEVIYAGGGTPQRAHAAWDAPDQVPEAAAEYPEFSMFGELPAWGFYTRHAREIAFHNCRFTLEHPDYRPAMVFDDVDGLRLGGVNLGRLSGEPVIVLDQVNAASIHGVEYPPGVPARERIRRLNRSS